MYVVEQSYPYILQQTSEKTFLKVHMNYTEGKIDFEKNIWSFKDVRTEGGRWVKTREFDCFIFEHPTVQ